MSLTLPDKKQEEIHTCSVLGGAPHWRHALFSQINSKLLLQKQGWLLVRKHHQHVSSKPAHFILSEIRILLVEIILCHPHGQAW